MSRRIPKLKDDPPRDSRSRRVIEAGPSMPSGQRIYVLECGHKVSRKMNCLPRRLICNFCESAGGITAGFKDSR